MAASGDKNFRDKTPFHHIYTIVIGVWLAMFKEDMLVKDFLSLSVSVSLFLCLSLSLSVSVFVSTERKGMFVCE